MRHKNPLSAPEARNAIEATSEAGRTGEHRCTSRDMIDPHNLSTTHTPSRSLCNTSTRRLTPPSRTKPDESTRPQARPSKHRLAWKENNIRRQQQPKGSKGNHVAPPRTHRTSQHHREPNKIRPRATDSNLRHVLRHPFQSRDSTGQFFLKTPTRYPTDHDSVRSAYARPRATDSNLWHVLRHPFQSSDTTG